MPGGRPKKFKSVEDIDERVKDYKKYIKDENSVPTMAGLAYYLEIDRQTLYNYAKNEEFFDTIKKYRDWVLMKIEENCAIRGHGGSIFLAKNYGYTDRQEVNVNTVEDDPITLAIKKSLK